MTPEDKELCERLEGTTNVLVNVWDVRKEAAAAIERLSVERDREKFLREFSEEVCRVVQNQREAYRAISSTLREQIMDDGCKKLLLRTQEELRKRTKERDVIQSKYDLLAEAQPVATWLGTDWNAHHQCFAQLAHLDPGTELYIHPAADAKDAERLRVAIRKVLQHHGIAKHGDGVIEADLIAAMKGSA